jgi:hypothetical protein
LQPKYKEKKMANKKFFTGMTAVVFKLCTLALFVCGLTSCALLQEAPPVEYKEIDFSELENAIKKRTYASEFFIVDAYITGIEGISEYSSAYISEDPRPGSGQRIELHLANSLTNKYGALQLEYSNGDEIRKRIIPGKKYKIYIGIYHQDFQNVVLINKIDGLGTVEEASAVIAEQKAAEEAKIKAEEDARTAKWEAQKKEEAAANELKFNPGKLDRSKYKEITVEDFSFDMVAGKLPAGSKVAFKAMFLTKPTGTKYLFDDVNIFITLSSNHNFVRDMPEACFGAYSFYGTWVEQRSVKVFVTVKKPGQNGECTVDIVEW